MKIIWPLDWRQFNSIAMFKIDSDRFDWCLMSEWEECCPEIEMAQTFFESGQKMKPMSQTCLLRHSVNNKTTTTFRLADQSKYFNPRSS